MMINIRALKDFILVEYVGVLKPQYGAIILPKEKRDEYNLKLLIVQVISVGVGPQVKAFSDSERITYGDKLITHGSCGYQFLLENRRCAAIKVGDIYAKLMN